MKRGKFSFLRFTLLWSLTAVFLYSASVQEIHYLFVDHHTEVNEHCHNHLHAHVNHVECNLCKIELSSFLQSPCLDNSANPPYLKSTDIFAIRNVTLHAGYSSISPRGPPFNA